LNAEARKTLPESLRAPSGMHWVSSESVTISYRSLAALCESLPFPSAHVVLLREVVPLPRWVRGVSSKPTCFSFESSVLPLAARLPLLENLRFLLRTRKAPLASCSLHAGIVSAPSDIGRAPSGSLRVSAATVRVLLGSSRASSETLRDLVVSDRSPSLRRRPAFPRRHAISNALSPTVGEGPIQGAHANDVSTRPHDVFVKLGLGDGPPPRLPRSRHKRAERKAIARKLGR
jgi:hypothetical protein